MSDLVFATDSEEQIRDDEKATMDFRLWRRLFDYILGYRKLLAIVAVCGTFTGGLEMVHGLITKWMIDDIQANGTQADLWIWVLLFLLASAVMAGVTSGFVYGVSKLRAFAAYDIRRETFLNVQKQSFEFFDKRPVGWLMARMTSDCERLTDILAWAFLDFVWGTTMMLSMGVAMFILNWKLALFALAILPVIAWVSVKFRKSILRTARDVRASYSQITSSFNESIMGVLTSKSFAREEKNLQEFTHLTNRLYDASVKNLTWSAIYVPFVFTLGSIAVGITLAIGGMEFLDGVIAASTLLVFMMWIRYFFDPIIELASWFAEMQSAQASAERVLAVMDAKPTIQSRSSSTNHLIERSIRSVELNSVAFEYVAGERVLSDINLSVKAGQTVAFVGPTGGGKTTLVNLLCRFYEPTSGRILVNGVDYREISLEWFRSQLGVVLQQAHAFSGSILENIRYGKLDASDEEVRQAAKTAGAHAFIEDMENGYFTEVGSGGSRLSAGQKQLISIARAILADPQILVLDEATSSIDPSTEEHIQRGLDDLLKNRISFVIAHRLSTIRNADKIVLIKDGGIHETGSHRELLAIDGLYADLYRQQSLHASVESSFDLAERMQE